ncbi:uncharacterized protein AB675_1986 [Cyphellophora attinorum]|uniref:Mitochondrial integral membrane protein n=1 Tax=Cyphellophora attinorum TaxID=1664694 RepID=A0A0N0NPT6_9EURO|nr:uncharacterized protein AB675_1986 [Phialophora attinorum]KPI42919.1 hypothetical protein AB675_1986 [Phialophora attinorum]
MSLWGSSKNGEPREAEDDSHPRPTSSSREERDSTEEPTERTRLIAQRRPPPAGGYLDPDDPAVSPYNLWSVRAVRFFEVFFLMITFLWWVVLFISIFVSPPGMHSRGSGFFDVSYTTLTVGNIIIALLFFAVPSTPMGVLSFIISILLIVNMIIILVAPRIRLEEGWPGIASVVWAAIIGLYNILANRTVRWGKAEEEARLTGREEQRRTLKEWLAVLLATIFMVIFALIAVLLTATVSLRARDATLPAPGHRYLVDGDKYQVHVACVGNQTYDKKGNANPTVLLEGGYMPVEDSFEDWVYEAYQNGTIERYCYWDRPGLGWSDNAPSPHSASMSADALSEALAIAGEEGPWVLVSAGIGGIYSRVFSARHPRAIAGIMLIDALHEDLLYQIGNPGTGFLLWARGFISPLGLDRLPGALFKGRSREDRVYGKSSYQGGKFIKNKLQENLVADGLTKNEVLSARNIQQPEVPLTVVSSGVHINKDKDWKRRQEDLTKITDNLVEWRIVKKAPAEEVWRTEEGRYELGDALKKLMKAKSK